MRYGTSIKQAQAVLTDDESVIWEKEVFGEKTAEPLQHTIFFYSCILFGLRGHDEHYELECDQFTVDSNHRGRFITFTGRSTKLTKED